MSLQSPPPPPPEPSPAALGPLDVAERGGAGLSRRRVLQLTGAAGLLVGAGSSLYALVRGARAGAGRVCFSDVEADVAGKIAEALFPGPPRSPLTAEAADLVGFADRYVGGLFDDT